MRNKTSGNSLYRSRGYYSSGSLAYKQYDDAYYDFDYSHYNMRRKRPRTGIKKQKSPRRAYVETKKKITYKTALNEKTFHSLRIYFAILVVFVFSMLVVSSNAMFTEQKQLISSLRMELKEIQDNNTNLKIELTQSIDNEAIEALASAKLGMQKPAPYQIVYIDVPKQSYTTQHEIQSDSNTEQGFFQILQNINSYLKDK